MTDDIAQGKRTKPSPEQIQARREAFAESAHQSKMEGMPLGTEYADLHEAHILGELSTEEFRDAVYARIVAARAAPDAS